MAGEVEGAGCDSDGSLSWEDFFGKPTELVPTLLGMYDALVGRPVDAAHAPVKTPASPASATPPLGPPPGGGSGPGGGGGELEQLGIAELGVPRPLSVSSIASSSSSSSGTSSCSGNRRLGLAPKSSAYLASIESLDDTDDEDDLLKGANKSVSSQGSGSGDSGVCSPCSHLAPPLLQQQVPGCRHPHPHLSFMDRVVMEILETEGVYVRDLQQIIAGYLKVLHSRADCPLGASQLDALFGNIQDVYRFNSNFLRQLEQCDLDPVRVARCFVRNNAGFSVYTEYCTNYPRTVGVLTELMRREATVRLFRERQAALQHTLPLGSYLLKPVQRILKYHLLLQNIVKHSSCERHGRDGYSDIVNALSTMTAIAHHINDMKRRHEHAVRVQEIQSLLYGWEGEDLTTFGELCAEGTFRVAGAKALRHVFLFDKMLLITKKKEESILGYKAHIECSNLMLIESVPGEPLSFHVIPFDNPRMQYTLQARTLEQKREWSLQLKRVILENYHAVIPSHARQLVMELGPSRPDGAIQSDKVTPRRQHSAPEYLERRKQERERRKSETGLRYRLRRNRKSDADTIAESATRRGRRGSSSSREGEREDSILSLADRTRDRIASWRRKSEPAGPALPPGAVGLSSGKRQLSIDLQIPSLDAQPSLPSPVNGTARSAATVGTVVNGNSSSTTTSCEPEKCSSGQVPIENLPSANVLLEPSQVEILPSEPSTDNSTVKEPSTLPSLPQQPVETIEQIVSQLLMQNREFQKILKNQQRQLSRRHRITSQNVAPCAKGETTDEDADEEVEEEEEAIYETLSALATVQHRHLHYSHSHSVECSNDEDDYVTLVCHNGAEVDEDDDEDDAASTRCLEDALGEDGSPPTAPPRPRARLKRGSTASLGKETEAEVEARAGRPATRQDSLQSLWERLRRSQRLGGPGPGSSGRLAASVRRAASFSSQRSARSAHSNSHFYVDTPIGGADCQPITPAVWLKQQGPHLMTASSHKAGSLPRSFQVGPEGEALPGRSKETLRARMLRSGRSCPDRPFTIASDKPSRLSMEDMDERFHSGSFGAQHGDTTEDDSMTEYTATPNASLASLHEPSVHPEYRIYRPTLPFSSMSIRQVLSKLASGLRGSSPASPGGSVADDDWEQQRARLRERRRVAAVVVKQYSKTLRRRIRNLMGDEDTSSPTTPLTPPSEGAQAAIPTTAATTTTTTTTYKQGSSGLGARIASSESDYANPRLLFQHVRPSKKAAALLGVRPDSVLSVVSAASSTFTVSASTSSSSSDGDKTSGFEGSVDTTVGIGRSSKADAAAAKGAAPLTEADMDERTTVVSSSSAGEEVADSDCSADSFYERSFEAMESVLEATDVFRDSAVFSDHDVESDDSSTPPSYPPPPPPPPHQYSTTANLPVSTTTCSTSFSTSDSIVLNLTDSSLPLPVLVSSTHSSRIPMASETTKSKVPPPVPTKPKKTFRASFIVGDLANIPMTPLVSKLSDVGAPLTAPLAVPDQDDSSSTSAASTVIEACASQRSRRASETALWARTSGPEPISLEQLPEGPCTLGSGACPGACGGSCPSGPASKGWVKHVIGRLQGESVG